MLNSKWTGIILENESTGATKNKPIGTVVIGISDANNVKIIDTFYFKGTREEVQIQAAKTALKKILKFVKKTLDN